MSIFLQFFVAPRVVENEYDEDGVRAPIPQKQETLIQPGKFFHKFSNFRFFFSKFYFEEFPPIFKKVKKWIFNCILKL